MCISNPVYDRGGAQGQAEPGGENSPAFEMPGSAARIRRWCRAAGLDPASLGGERRVIFFWFVIAPFRSSAPVARSARNFSPVPTQCPTVRPRFRAQAVTPLAPHLPQAVPLHLDATSARSLSRTRYTPPPPLLAHRSPIHHLRGATRRRRRCSEGRFTTNRGAAPKLNRHHEAAPQPAAAGRIPAKSPPLRASFFKPPRVLSTRPPRGRDAAAALPPLPASSFQYRLLRGGGVGGRARPSSSTTSRSYSSTAVPNIEGTEHRQFQDQGVRPCQGPDHPPALRTPAPSSRSNARVFS
ncbi:uncharacterized protein LOC120713557 [Panicum virgatum]|uniref:uncharacterized protein LOC120713557 n=1 Tax=Panicum virgatum TaxID=38727 RepID=UPI0019D58B4A|nr:uncharacterized protein LOC120713557 [Panicum virgatum]